MSKSAAVFNKKKFINDVTETVRHMYRKQLKEASQQEIFQAVSYVVKGSYQALYGVMTAFSFFRVKYLS